jgi:mannan endo-1,4-beta-mannosidase
MPAIGDILRAGQRALRAPLANPRRLLGWVLVVCGGLVTAGAAAAQAPGGVLAISASPYVSASGGKLILEGQPWRFTGYDAYQLTSVAVGAKFNCGGQYSTSWLNQMLDEMKSTSGTSVVRTWFFQSYSADNYIQFDTVLAAAAKRNIKIIPVLVNQWNDCEPWTGTGRPYKPLSWYQGGYKVADDGYPLSFRDYATAMAARYANNKTIAFWQLVNEAEAMQTANGPCDESAAAQAIRSFADDVATAMKARDPNHLISLGTIGTGQCGTSGPDYRYVHSGAIDLCEYHDYVSGPVSGDQWNGILPDISVCQALRKPIFAGEVGIDASVQTNWSANGSVTSTSLQQRAGFFNQKLQAQFDRGVSGFLDWDKTLGDSSGYDIGLGDPVEGVMAAMQSEVGLAPAPGVPAKRAPRRPTPWPAPKVPPTAAPAAGSPSATAAAVVAPPSPPPGTPAPSTGISAPQPAAVTFPRLSTAVQGAVLGGLLLLIWALANVATGGRLAGGRLRKLVLLLLEQPRWPADG